MSRLATPEVGILGCRAGMPGWMVGGPGASVTRARSPFVVLPSTHGDYQLSVMGADAGQKKSGCIGCEDLRCPSAASLVMLDRVPPDRTPDDWIARVLRSLTIVVTSTGPMTWNYDSMSIVAVADKRWSSPCGLARRRPTEKPNATSRLGPARCIGTCGPN